MASMESQWESLARAIAAARSARGWIQEELAKEAGVSRSTIQNFEGTGSREYKRLPSSAAVIEHALGWPPGAMRAILAGGEPPKVIDVVVSDTAAPRQFPALPLRVAEELTTGDPVDTVIMNLSEDGSGLRLIAVLKADDAAKVDPETYRRNLDTWVQIQRRAHGLPTNESAPDAADGA